jgi:hypothetical protein
MSKPIRRRRLDTKSRLSEAQGQFKTRAMVAVGAVLLLLLWLSSKFYNG